MISIDGALSQMRTYRDVFEENYKAVPELRGSGRGVRMRYVYIGLWYVWDLPPRRIRAVKWFVGLACALCVLLFFAGGSIHSPLNHARYVQLPGTLSIAALVFEMFGAAQFCAAKERMTCMDFRDIRGKLLAAPLLHGILLLCAAAAAVWQVIRTGFLMKDVVVILCYFCSALLSLALFFCIRSLSYRTDKNADAGIGLDGGDQETGG